MSASSCDALSLLCVGVGFGGSGAVQEADVPNVPDAEVQNASEAELEFVFVRRLLSASRASVLSLSPMRRFAVKTLLSSVRAAMRAFRGALVVDLEEQRLVGLDDEGSVMGHALAATAFWRAR